MDKKYKAAGIVVEYNPLHNGHIYHINKTKEITDCDVLVAVMSPHFVQRGEPAIIDKFNRTQLALEHGVDIVVELPTHLTLQSAEIFSKSAIQLLSLMKVDHVVYGSESLTRPVLNKPDKLLLDQGYSYAKAKNTNMHKPNQILGAYYEKYAKQYNIQTDIILRTRAYHDKNIYDAISSASAIREAYYNNLPFENNTPVNLNNYTTYNIEALFPFIRYQILLDKDNLASYLLVDEGIENLLYKNAVAYHDYESFLNASVSRRYTESRIRRTLMHILLKTPRNIPNLSQVRILGMNEKGQRYLKQIKKDAPVVTTFKNYEFKDLELKASAILSLISDNKNQLLKQEVGKITII